MNIAILIISDDVIKIIDTSEYGKMKSVFKDFSLVCPSCKTKLKHITKKDGNEIFIAENRSYHSLCKKEVSKNFFAPINRELFLKLSEEDITKYLKILCNEYQKVIKMPISNIVRSKVDNLKSLDFNKMEFKARNNFIVEVREMYSFLKNPKERVFLIAEINRCYLNKKFVYLDLLAGNNKISVHLDNKIINTLDKKDINLIKSINNKNRKFIVAMYIDRISLKKSGGINISVKSKKFINIQEIRE